ncbi:hypothetical protein GS399_18790 [Pedobacter sp. HMF7647]|uniref:Uncharacterized protein n=1 Tax=Hufsiella arboris TaxID=2695275 RepID=A0A7K1YEK7_9SPHI|nr:hypothetical protein [Hufsiella arboris]MXV53022.1 hypothetical protein [Hufsiella arboris]
MALPDENFPELNDTGSDRDRTLKDDLGETIDQNDLAFNEEENSYELDVKSDDPDYDHPDPYDTAAPNGEDDNSDWDEANPYVGDEYDKDLSLETEVDKLGMHIDKGSIVEVDPVDEKLAETEEDKRDDLDEEGYPKNDQV